MSNVKCGMRPSGTAVAPRPCARAGVNGLRSSCALVLWGRRRINQCEPRTRIQPAEQMPGSLGDHDFECGSNVALQEVTAVRRSVRLAENDMRVHLWLAVSDGDVARERQYLDLLLDRNRLLPVTMLAR